MRYNGQTRGNALQSYLSNINILATSFLLPMPNDKAILNGKFACQLIASACTFRFSQVLCFVIEFKLDFINLHIIFIYHQQIFPSFTIR